MKKALLTFRFEAKSFLPFLFFMLVASGIFAQNAALSVQGVLTKTDGTAVDDGNYSMTFSLWTASGGGTKVHEETLSQVETTGGVYSVLLGANGFDPTATFSQVYYLGVQVNGGAELSPRPRLTHAPYTTSVVGQNNIFPSVGPVLGDAIRAKGGTPTGGTGAGANGFAFGAGGDTGGGLFSAADGEVSLYTDEAERIKVTSALTDIKTTNVQMNGLTVNGIAQGQNFAAAAGLWTNGSPRGYTFQGGGDGDGGLFSNGDGQVSILTNGGERFRVGPTNIEILSNFRLTSSGDFVCGNDGVGNFKAPTGNNGGHTFYTVGVFEDNDTGMFSSGDGQVSLQTNGSVRFQASAGGSTTVFTPAGQSLLLPNIKQRGDFRELQWDQSTGELSWETSSRRFKQNIQPLVDDFRLILKAQPKTYTRPALPNKYEIGYIAEEMDSIGLKNLIYYDAEGVVEGYNYEKTILYAVEVLKMQDAALAKMQAELDALKKEKSDLAAQNSTLDAALKSQQAQFSAQLSELEKRMKMIENQPDRSRK